MDKIKGKFRYGHVKTNIKIGSSDNKAKEQYDIIILIIFNDNNLKYE